MPTLKKSSPSIAKMSAKNKVSRVVNHTFSDGTKFRGTVDQLEKVASALGMKIVGIGKVPKGYYMSESRGLVKISGMNDHHIRRAIIKRSKDILSEIYNSTDSNEDFMKKFSSVGKDAVVANLFEELSKR